MRRPALPVALLLLGQLPAPAAALHRQAGPLEVEVAPERPKRHGGRLQRMLGRVLHPPAPASSRPPPARGAPPPRVALLKFQRTASSFMMQVLEQAACRHWDCKGHWKPEVLTELCGHKRAACSPEAALGMIGQYTGCSDGNTSCGWSLNLLRHDSIGVRIWDRLVEQMAKQPTLVIFLTRDNTAAQYISYEVGSQRREVMNNPAFFRDIGATYKCNAFHFSNCNPEQRDWVNQHTSFELDPKRVHNSVLEYERNNNIYRKLETELRQKNLPNIKVLHLTYEQLYLESTWRELFDTLGLKGELLPKMAPQSKYQRFVSNWDAVDAQFRAMGYNVTQF